MPNSLLRHATTILLDFSFNFLTLLKALGLILPATNAFLQSPSPLLHHSISKGITPGYRKPNSSHSRTSHTTTTYHITYPVIKNTSSFYTTSHISISPNPFPFPNPACKSKSKVIILSNYHLPKTLSTSLYCSGICIFFFFFFRTLYSIFYILFSSHLTVGLGRSCSCMVPGSPSFSRFSA